MVKAGNSRDGVGEALAVTLSSSAQQRRGSRHPGGGGECLDRSKVGNRARWGWKRRGGDARVSEGDGFSLCVFTVGSSRTRREALKRDWLGGGRERRWRQGAALSMRLKSWYQPPPPPSTPEPF